MSKIKIASFNVNSIKARLPRFLEWLKSSNPDIVLLQELKCVEAEFPFEALLDAGYNAAVVGQKTYNGVAILSKFKIEDVVKNLPAIDESSDEQARYIEGVIAVNGSAIRVASIYVPNGGGEIPEGCRLEDTEKFLYKLNFFKRLKAHFSRLLTYNEIQIFGGDFNVANQDIDVYDAKSLKGSVCFNLLEQQNFRSILNLGLIDSYRAFNGNNHQAFSWWDYRSGAWQHNKGLRIDYLLTSPSAADKIISATIEDKGVRDQEKASDHCPVCVEIAI
jgi:exodeoxyribonuclease-3